MKKQLLGLLIGLGLVLAPTSYAKADTQIDEQYKEAYDLTMKVVDIADKYQAAPASKYGSWRYNQVFDAVKEGKLDEEMLKARKKINNLPKCIQIQKNGLSQILDGYEDQLYHQVTGCIQQLGNDIYYGRRQESPLDIYKSVDYCQKMIMKERRLIANIRDEYRPTYSNAVDMLQNDIYFTVHNWKYFIEGKDPSVKYYFMKSIETVQNNIEDSNPLKKQLSDVAEKSKTLKPCPGLGDDEILKFALNNGFKEALSDESSKYKDEKAYKVLLNSNGDSIEFYKNSNTLLFKYKKSGEASRQAVLGFLAPNAKDILVRLNDKTSGDEGFLDKGLLVNLTPSDKEIVYEFYRF